MAWYFVKHRDNFTFYLLALPPPISVTVSLRWQDIWVQLV